MTPSAPAPVPHLIRQLVRRHGITDHVALDMLQRAARRRGTSVHELATTITGLGAERDDDEVRAA